MLKYAFLFLFAAPSSASDFELNSLKASDPAFTGPVPAPQAAPAVPGKAGYIQLSSSIKVKVDREKGQVTVGFPKVDFGGEEPGDKAQLFVKVTRGLPAPAVSWATVLCSGGNFLGYKGSNISLPESSGSFSVNETLALGYPKRLIAGTHPWLAGDLASVEEVCSEAFLEKMKDARAETLPQQLGEFSFSYDVRKNTLKIKWRAPHGGEF